MTSVILADDHIMIRQGLLALLHQQSDLEVIAEADNGQEALRLVRKHRPDVAILDVAMPQMNGVEAARAIGETSPDTVIVALSMYGDAHYIDLMFEAGASAYVLKDEAVGELIVAIRAALRGSKFVSPAIVRKGILPSTRSADLGKRSLSRRELEVLRLITDGKKAREISETLNISVKTVETHRSRIMIKLGIDNVPGLVKFAIKAGITTPHY